MSFVFLSFAIWHLNIMETVESLNRTKFLDLQDKLKCLDPSVSIRDKSVRKKRHGRWHLQYECL